MSKNWYSLKTILYGQNGAELDQQKIRFEVRLLEFLPKVSFKLNGKICGERRMLVQDKTFEEWRMAKCENGYNKLFEKWAEKDLSAFVRCDRNHPCIFMWSIGNEINEQRAEDGWKTTRNSYFCIIDLAGMKKDRFYLYQSRWNPEAKTLHILPHWNWEDRIGQNVPVHCYTSFDKSELL